MSETMSCCVFGNDDFEGPSAFTEKIRTARKTHRCGECGKPIAVGDKYEHASGIWDGRASSFKTCSPCVDIRTHFSNSCRSERGYGGSWVYGEIWINIVENFFPDMKAGGPCMVGMSPRAKAKMFERYLEWYEEGEHDGAPPPRPYTPNEGTPP